MGEELEEGEEDGGKENVDSGNVMVEEEKAGGKVEKMDKTEAEVAAEYGLDDYDEEEEGGAAPLLGLGDLTTFADPSEDPYLSAMDRVARGGGRRGQRRFQNPRDGQHDRGRTRGGRQRHTG